MELVGKDSVSIEKQDFNPEECWVRLEISSTDADIWFPEWEDWRWQDTKVVEVT